MDQSLSILTNFVTIFVIGIVVSIISKKLKISNLLLLMLTGLGMGYISRTYELFPVSETSMITIAILALVMIIFDGSSRFNYKSLDDFSVSALKLTSAFVIINMVFLGFLISILFFEKWTLVNVLYSLVFAIIISGTDPASVFTMLKSKTSKVIEFLEVEAILNTPIIIIFPYIILDMISQLGGKLNVNLLPYLESVVIQIIVGIGTGVLVGLIFFKAMKKFYSEEISPLAIITAAALSYILAENLNGNGVLAVAVLGLIFGNIYVANKSSLQEFSSMLSNTLEILVFILLGYIIKLQVDTEFILKSLVVFVVIIFSRYLALIATTKNHGYSKKERWFMALNMPKGIAVAVLVFSLSLLGLAQLDTINNLIILVMIYSLVISTMVNKFADKFLRLNINLKN